MIKKLLVVFAAAAVISLVCFTLLGVMGGFPNNFGKNWGGYGPPWPDGPGRDPGPEATRNLPYSGAERLDLGFPAEITVTQGPETRFTVTGPEYILDQLHLEGGSLQWDGSTHRPWRRRYHGRLRIDIVSPNLHEFHLSGAQELRLKNFDQDTLVIHASGAADVSGQGRAHRVEAQISGAGDLKLDELAAEEAEVTISGAGDARLDARNYARVQISGAGHVQLKCRPTRGVDVQKTGFGDVGYGPDCSTLPPPAAPGSPQTPAEPAKPASPANPAPKTKV